MKVLYNIIFKSGEIVDYQDQFFENDKSTPSLLNETKPGTGIAIELILHCTKGDIGPLPISQLTSEEERTIDLWSADYGNPKYCIVIMYREKTKYFPQWSIPSCKVKIVRQTEVYESLFQHTMPISGGSANVYSLTMSPSKTSNQTVTYGDTSLLNKKD
jgi:hypothetical protein